MKDKIRNEFIKGSFGVDELPCKIVQRRSAWFGHIERRQHDEHLLRKVSEMEVEGKRRRGRPKRRWRNCVNDDMESLGITIALALDRTAWKANLHKERPHTRVGQASSYRRRLCK